MITAVEIAVLIGLYILSVIGLYIFNIGPALFTFVLPLSFLLLILFNWYYLIVALYRGRLNGRVFRRVIIQALVVVAVLGILYILYPQHFQIVKATYAFEKTTTKINTITKLGTSKSAKEWVSWAKMAIRDGDGPKEGLINFGIIFLVALPFLIAIIALRNFFENQLRAWTQRVFLRHQGRVASFLAEEEEVKKAFLVFEGLWHPFKILTAKPTMVLWTDARVILIKESSGLGPPAVIRSVPVISIRAVRGSDRFLRPIGLSLDLETLNRQRHHLWTLSRKLGEEMGEALANAVQQLRAIQGAYEGPVIRHICPFCFAEAGKGEVPEEICPVCSRSLRKDKRDVALSALKYCALVTMVISLTAWLFGPEVTAICRGPKGERVVLDSHRLRVFNASGNVIKVGVLPSELRLGGGGKFLLPTGDTGTIVGGPSGVFLWKSGKFTKVLTGPKYGKFEFVTKSPAGGLAIVAKQAGRWVLHATSKLTGGKVKTTPMSILPVSPPLGLVGTMRGELLFSMQKGGVARYKMNGQRAGWLVHPDDSGVVLGGFVINNRALRHIDAEPLAIWNFQSNRVDLAQTVEFDGVVTKSTPLGDRRMPQFINCFLDNEGVAVRPELLCRGGGNDIWILDTLSGRLVRVTKTGKVLNDFCRGRLAQWLNEVRMWRAAQWGALILSILLFIVWITLKAYVSFSASRA